MIDIKWILQNPNVFDDAMIRRNSTFRAAPLIQVYQKHLDQLQRVQELKTRQNTLAGEIGQLKRQKLPADVQLEESQRLKQKLTEPEIDYLGELQTHLLMVPNVLAESVPDGVDETANVELFRTPNTFVGNIPHWELKGIDSEIAAKLSGSRFTVLRGPIARLERAIGQFMLDTHLGNGFEEVNVPQIVNTETLIGTGQLPKFKDDLYQTTTGQWLIPTAEVPLTNLVRDQIISEKLPLRYTALTACFRSEAGAAGKDARGMLRQHQFNKVELVSICSADQEISEFKRTVNAAKRILDLLDLPYRVMQLCSGDIGFSAQETIDLEVWLPGQNAYREISSISRCGTFQARRMNTRIRGENKTEFTCTINGSGLAVGRTLIAIVENYREPNYIRIPDILIPYMGGIDRIELNG